MFRGRSWESRGDPGFVLGRGCSRTRRARACRPFTVIIRAGVRSPPLCPSCAAALDPCRPMGIEQKVDQNHLMCPQLSVMAGATAGVQVADRNLDPGYFSPRSSSAEHLEVDTRFPFSPPGSGALRDVAYLEGCLFSAQVKCRMGVTFLRRSESEPAVLPGSAIPGIVLAGSLSAVITSVFPRLLV